MKLVALSLLTLFFFSCYHAAEAKSAFETEVAAEEVTKNPALVTEIVMQIVTAIGNLLSNLSDEQIQKILDFGKKVFQWGKALLEQIKYLRNVTSLIKGKRNATLVRREMDRLYAKMDQIDRGFDTIKTAIDWNVLKIKMADYEGAIKSLEMKLQHFMDAPENVSETYMDIFIEAYEQHFADAPLKIYYSMILKNRFFNKNLFEIAQKQFRNDIRDISKLAGYLILLIQRGIAVQIAYYGMTDQEFMIKVLEEEWEERFEKLDALGKEVDESVRGSWRTQSFADLDAAVKASERTTNDKLASQLYKQVSEKFKWRQWFVLVFKFTSNKKERHVDNCDGFEWANFGDKTVFVNSVPSSQTSPRIDVSNFFNAIPASVGSWSPFSNPAQRLFDMVSSSCEAYKFKGVIQSDAEVQMRSADGRAAMRSVEVKMVMKKTKNFMLAVFD